MVLYGLWWVGWVYRGMGVVMGVLAMMVVVGWGQCGNGAVIGGNGSGGGWGGVMHNGGLGGW